MSNTFNNYQVYTLTLYLVSKIIKDNIASGKLVNDDTAKLEQVKAKLAVEISARLCVTADSLTFNEVVDAITAQINIDDYIN